MKTNIPVSKSKSFYFRSHGKLLCREHVLWKKDQAKKFISETNITVLPYLHFLINTFQTFTTNFRIASLK